MILFGSLGLPRPLFPALGAVALPGSVAVEATVVLAEELGLCDVDPSLRFGPHPHLGEEITGTPQQ